MRTFSYVRSFAKRRSPTFAKPKAIAMSLACFADGRSALGKRGIPPAEVAESRTSFFRLS